MLMRVGRGLWGSVIFVSFLLSRCLSGDEACQSSSLNGQWTSLRDKPLENIVNIVGKHRSTMLPTFAIGQFRIVQQQKNRVEVQGNNLHFPLF